MDHVPWSGLGRIESEVHDINRSLHQKADSHEVHSLKSIVDRLEHSVREARSEIDGLRYRISELESRLQVDA